MLDFEDVTPRKRDTEENGEEQNENAADEMEMNHSEEEGHPEEEAAEEVGEKVSETEPVPQPSVREYHYEEQVKKAPKKKKEKAEAPKAEKKPLPQDGSSGL